jgi:hypothetical protein
VRFEKEELVMDKDLEVVVFRRRRRLELELKEGD